MSLRAQICTLRGERLTQRLLWYLTWLMFQKAVAQFREASERWQDTASKAYHIGKIVLNRLSVQKRLSNYNWNPGPRRAKFGAIEKRIAGRWHIITLQEASEYIDHVLLTRHFHVTHNKRCAVLYNMESFYANIDVKSIYLHDTRWDLLIQVMEGGQGWVLQGVLSRASFRRTPPNGRKNFTVLTLHISNLYARKRSIAKKIIFTIRAIMVCHQVDRVADDFKGTAWRCHNRGGRSTMYEAFDDCAMPTPPGPTPCWTRLFSQHLD